MHATDPIKLDDIENFEQLLDGEYVHESEPDSKPYWAPRCPDGYAVIAKAINKVLASQTCLQRQTFDEIHSIVKLELYALQGDGLHRKAEPRNFFDSTNRTGWLSLFVRNWGKNHIRKKIHDANGDKRVAESQATGIIPAESLTEQQTRKREGSPNFDLSDWEPRDETDTWVESDAVSVYRHKQRLEDVRDVMSRLSDDDQEFLDGYLDRKAHTPAERKRWQRLKDKLREMLK